MKVRILFLLLCVLLLTTAGYAGIADWTDFDEAKAGTQSASWPEPTTIKVYTDAITGANLTNIKVGIDAWDSLLHKISIEYVAGDRPAGAGGVQLEKVATLPGGAKAYGEAEALFGAGESHGEIDRGIIKIIGTETGENFWRNVGAHEFGHVLGFKDLAESSPRTKIMDPALGGAYLPPNLSNTALLDMEHYTFIVPEPATLLLFGFGAMMFRRKD